MFLCDRIQIQHVLNLKLQTSNNQTPNIQTLTISKSIIKHSKSNFQPSNIDLSLAIPKKDVSLHSKYALYAAVA